MSTELEAFKAMILTNDFVVLDTETTGLERGEICSVSIIDSAGNVLLDTLVKPVNGIPADASRIHGIFNHDVANAPGWAEVSPQVERILTGRNVVIYNAVYDRKMMHQSAEAAGLPKTDWKTLATFHCAMEAFAERYGDFNSYRGNYRWQRLSTAADFYNVRVINAHSAKGDCLMTLGVVMALAREEQGITQDDWEMFEEWALSGHYDNGDYTRLKRIMKEVVEQFKPTIRR